MLYYTHCRIKDESLVNQTVDKAAGSPVIGEICKDLHRDSIKSYQNGMCRRSKNFRRNSIEQQVGSEQQGDDSKQLQSHGWRGTGSLLGFKNTNGYTVELLMGENIVFF